MANIMDDAIIALQIILCSCGNVLPLGNTYIVLKASSYFDVRHMSEKHIHCSDGVQPLFYDGNTHVG